MTVVVLNWHHPSWIRIIKEVEILCLHHVFSRSGLAIPLMQSLIFVCLIQLCVLFCILHLNWCASNHRFYWWHDITHTINILRSSHHNKIILFCYHHLAPRLTPAINPDTGTINYIVNENAGSVTVCLMKDLLTTVDFTVTFIAQEKTPPDATCKF